MGMFMLTPADYFMGRDKSHPDELTDSIRANAAETVRRANLLLEQFYVTGGVQREVTSGWRPKRINSTTPGAARGSHHIPARAIDIDDEDRELAHWCAAHEAELEAVGIWMERPEATLTWVHWQIVPPGSRARFFWPTVTSYRLFVASGAQPIIV